jgi:hypothetical protein
LKTQSNAVFELRVDVMVIPDLQTMNNAPGSPPQVSPGSRLRVTSAVAAMHGDPRISSAWTSQLLAGHVVRVNEVRGDWLHVRSEDQYEGWMHRGYLVPCSDDEGTWRISMGCRVVDNGREVELPLLARLTPTAHVLRGRCIDAAEQLVEFPPDAGAIGNSASTLFAGASYVWGGVSPWGCDCSGFTQSIFALHGIALPRDASQQAVAFGELDRTTPVESLALGALPFFTDREDGRITHVGIMLGESRMAHSGLARGGFNVENFADGNDWYVAKLRANYVGAAYPVRMP